MKTVTIYGCCMGTQCGNATALLLEPFPEPQTMSINGREFTCDTSLSWNVRVPDEAELIRDSRDMLSLQVGNRSYSANNLFALADLELEQVQFVFEGIKDHQFPIGAEFETGKHHRGVVPVKDVFTLAGG